MGIVGHERPGVQAPPRLEHPCGQAIKEQPPSPHRAEDAPPLDTTHDDVMQGAGVIETRPTWHTPIVGLYSYHSQLSQFARCNRSSHSPLRPPPALASA